MADRAILAIDQGTTNTKALLIAQNGGIIAEATCATSVDYPRPGWAEQSPEIIWNSVLDVVRRTVAASRGWTIAAIGISNQRESALLWERDTAEPIGPCILWQCRRTSARCADLRAEGFEAMVAAKTGLRLDPLFSATKLAWLLDQSPNNAERAARGELQAGTVDSWLLRKLTGRHATDFSNASRTQLLSISSGTWDDELCELFGVPRAVLPEVQPSDSFFGETSSELDGIPPGIPVQAMMGDSHAALFGHGIEQPGRVKVTIGTGSSLMTPTPRPVTSSHGLSTTIAWRNSQTTVYALEGNIAISGQAAAFAAKLLGVADQQALCELANSVPDNGGVSLVPALAGLGAPHWRDNARGMICGMSLSTMPGHIARAAYEGIALQIRDVFASIEADIRCQVESISVDGGASSNDFLMQLLADVLDRPAQRMNTTEVSALGAARMAGRAIGMSIPHAKPKRTFVPSKDEVWRSAMLATWNDAIARASYAA